MLLDLLLTPEGELDPAYTDANPLVNRMQNTLHLLHYHLKHPENAAVIGPLVVAARKIGTPASCLLKLLCPCLFQSTLYGARSRLYRNMNNNTQVCTLTKTLNQGLYLTIISMKYAP